MWTSKQASALHDCQRFVDTATKNNIENTELLVYLMLVKWYKSKCYNKCILRNL